MENKLIKYIRERLRRFNGDTTISWEDTLDLISFGVTPYLANCKVVR